MDIVHVCEIGKVREMLSPSRESQLKFSNTPQKRFQKRFQKTFGHNHPAYLSPISILCQEGYKLLHDEGKTANSEDKKLSFLVKLELAFEYSQ